MLDMPKQTKLNQIPTVFHPFNEVENGVWV